MSIKSNIKANENLLKRLSIIITFFILIISTIATVNAHILVVGDTMNDLPDERQETMSIYKKLVSSGYPVVLLIGENATAENIIKGMYGADAVIYVGHGSDLGYYQNDGGISKAPYALPTSDDTGIWTNKNLLSEGLNYWGFNYNGEFVPPIKKGASVIFLHTCFTTGWVENTIVSNVDETIYKFNIPYVDAGANVYSSGYYQVYDNFFDGVLGQELADGGEISSSYQELNEKLTNANDKINTDSYKQYKDMKFNVNEDYGSLFIGDLNANVLPKASECGEYDSKAAENWYDSGKSTNDPIYNSSKDLKSSNTTNNDDDFFKNVFGLNFDFMDDFFDRISIAYKQFLNIFIN